VLPATPPPPGSHPVPIAHSSSVLAPRLAHSALSALGSHCAQALSMLCALGSHLKFFSVQLASTSALYLPCIALI
jgi:hypothetical protein